MINHDDGPRHELFLRGGLDAADVVRAHAAALRVVRSGIETAHLDAYSDGDWPQDVMPSYQHALSIARNAVACGTRSAKDDPGMGIDVDVRDDAQFDTLLALANSPPRAMPEFAELFPNARLVIQPGAGHFPWLDDPDRFVATTAAFLG